MIEADSFAWFGEGKEIEVPAKAESPDSQKVLRNAVKAWAKKNFSDNEKVINKETEWDIQITPSGIKIPFLMVLTSFWLAPYPISGRSSKKGYISIHQVQMAEPASHHIPLRARSGWMVGSMSSALFYGKMPVGNVSTITS